MKKTIFLFFTLFLITFLLVGCGPDEGAEANSGAWDGQIASAFAGGLGTEEDPYRIENAAQLAFLAKSVNEGESYAGKYLTLSNDIDLNHVEWTPIGNGSNSFSGVFEGNHHSIINLNVTKGANYTVQFSAGRDSHQYAMGLFGTCVNPTIRNLTIQNAKIMIPNVSDAMSSAGSITVNVGILVGEVQADEGIEITGITISNAVIQVGFEFEEMPYSLYAGGLAGYMRGVAEVVCTVSEIQSELQVSMEKSRAMDNSVGGIIGRFSMERVCTMENFVSYLSVRVDTENCYTGGNYFGAFGELVTWYTDYNSLTLTNVFSKVTVNKIHDYFHGYSAYTAYAIAGKTYPVMSERGGCQFENLFGFVEQVDEGTGEKVIATNLYEITYPENCSETNCQGCEALPQNHGFDESIWNLTDLSNPKLK